MTAICPTDSMAATCPTDNMAAICPTDNMAATCPTDNMAATCPTDNMAAICPTDNMAATCRPTDMAVTCYTDNMAATCRPTDMAATCRPTDMATTCRPTDMAATCRPTDMAATCRPTDMAATCPTDKAATCRPTDMAATCPTDHTAATCPTDNMAATCRPTDMATCPTDNMAATCPNDNMASTCPTGNMADTCPTDNMAATSPTDNMAATCPTDNVAATCHTDNMAATCPVDKKATTYPTDNTAATVGEGKAAASHTRDSPSGRPCRYYQRRFPRTEDVVKVRVESVQDTFISVSLLEYGDLEGLIPISHVRNKRIRSMISVMRPGRLEVVRVIRVDEDKGWVDLSKKCVTAEEVEECNKRFAKSKCVENIVSEVASRHGLETKEELEDLYARIVWPSNCRGGENGGTTYETFKSAISDPEVLKQFDIPTNVKEVLLDRIKQKLALQPTWISSEIKVSCFGCRGIDAVKEALTYGLKMSSDDIKIKINLICTPIYLLRTLTDDHELGLRKVQEACAKVKEVIEQLDGNFQLRIPPHLQDDTNGDA